MNFIMFLKRITGNVNLHIHRMGFDIMISYNYVFLYLSLKVFKTPVLFLSLDLLVAELAKNNRD